MQRFHHSLRVALTTGICTAVLCFPTLALKPAQVDEQATSVWRETVTTSSLAVSRTSHVDFAANLAVSVGTIDGNATRAHVRAWDRISGVELWSRTFDDEAGLRLAVNSDGSLVYALLASQSDAGSPATERLVVLRRLDGDVIFEDEQTLAPVDPFDHFAGAIVDTLTLSPSGLTLYRVDFAPLTKQMRVTAIDTQTGAVRWQRTQAGRDYISTNADPHSPASAACAVDGSGLFVNYWVELADETYLAEIAFYSSLDGSETWLDSLDAGTDRPNGSQPFVLDDGSAVVQFRYFGPAINPIALEAFSTVDGTPLWSLPVSYAANVKYAFSPTTSRMVRLSRVYASSGGTFGDLRVQCFDLSIGTQVFELDYGDQFHSDSRHIDFDDTGSRIYIGYERTLLPPSTEIDYSIRALDASDGTSLWSAPLYYSSDGPGFHYKPTFWLDAPAPGGVHSLISASNSVRLTNTAGETRRALSADLGEELWVFETVDSLPSSFAPVGRVFAGSDPASVWTCNLIADEQFDQAGLELQQRSLATGDVLDSFVLDDPDLVPANFNVSFSPYAPLALFARPLPGSFESQVVLRDLSTDAETVLNLGTVSESVDAIVRWTADGTRAYIANVASVATGLFAIDLGAASLAWDVQYQPPSGFPGFGGGSCIGLAVDPITNDVFAEWSGFNSFPGSEVAELVKRRYAFNDGSQIWSTTTNAEDLASASLEFETSAPDLRVQYFDTRHTALELTQDGTTLYYAGRFERSGNPATVVNTDSSNGATRWVRFSASSLGSYGRIVETAVSSDGGTFYVLAESRSQFYSFEQAESALLWAIDSATGTTLFEVEVANDVYSARGLKLLGSGERLCVGFSRFAATRKSLGSVLVTLDARTGEELTTFELAGGELFDFMVAADGSLVHVGEDAPVAGVQAGLIERLALPSMLDGANGLSISAGGEYPLHAVFGPERAGDAYIILGSSSGTTPGTQVGAVNLPLVFDPYFLSTLQTPNTGIFQNTFALLSNEGDARGALVVPPGLADISLIGQKLFHAVLVWDLQLGQFVEGSTAVVTTLQP